MACCPQFAHLPWLAQRRLSTESCFVACSCIYSGSWDYSVRVWHRSSLALAGIVPFDDWVFSLNSRADHLLAGVSSRLHVLDLATLKPLKRIWHQVRPQAPQAHLAPGTYPIRALWVAKPCHHHWHSFFPLFQYNRQVCHVCCMAIATRSHLELSKQERHGSLLCTVTCPAI